MFYQDMGYLHSSLSSCHSFCLHTLNEKLNTNSTGGEVLIQCFCRRGTNFGPKFAFFPYNHKIPLQLNFTVHTRHFLSKLFKTDLQNSLICLSPSKLWPIGNLLQRENVCLVLFWTESLKMLIFPFLRAPLPFPLV